MIGPDVVWGAGGYVRERLDYVDVAKGIGMLAIMLAHVGFVAADGSSPVSPLTAQFHVPIFFLVSGFFVSVRQPLVVFVRTRARRLLTPYVLTCAVLGAYVAGCMLCVGVTRPPTLWDDPGQFARAVLWGAGVLHGTLPEGVGCIGAIWFLEALFVALVEVRLLLGSGLQEGARVAISAVLAVVAILSAQMLLLPCNVQTGLFGGLYVMLGHAYAKHGGLGWRASTPAMVALCVCCAAACVLRVGVSVAAMSTTWGPLGIAVSLSTSTLVLQVAMRIANRPGAITRFLRFIGRNSLAVMCVHLLCLDMGLRFAVRMLLGIDWGDELYNVTCAVDLVLQLLICSAVVCASKRLPR